MFPKMINIEPRPARQFLYHKTFDFIQERRGNLRHNFKRRPERKKRLQKPDKNKTRIQEVQTQPQRNRTLFSLHACTNFRVRKTSYTHKNDLKYSKCLFSRLLPHVPKLIYEFTCIFRGEKLLFRRTTEKFKCGVHGIVAYYKTTYETQTRTLSPEYKLCVKHTTDRTDVAVVRRLNDGKDSCGQVPAKIIKSFDGTKEYYFENNLQRERQVYGYAMPAYTGSLLDFVGQGKKLKKSTAVRVIRDLYVQLTCLREEKELCYMDIKPANILYVLSDVDDTDTIIVTVADLGSENKSSYHCPFSEKPQHPNCNNPKNPEARFCLEYNLIILLASLFYSEKKFYKEPWLLLSQNPHRFFSTYPQPRREHQAVRSKRLRNQAKRGAEKLIHNDFSELADILLPWTQR